MYRKLSLVWLLFLLLAACAPAAEEPAASSPSGDPLVTVYRVPT